ncbi:MAG: hypothetical protein BMS9Abin15_0662 [Gammaproteobacteria bacterium]|nr:MAG: hypothetical protein BMS9Abin15_0662 [Gammaproteobacteria bacterium]
MQMEAFPDLCDESSLIRDVLRKPSAIGSLNKIAGVVRL